jgi:SAM-dependent methyltransferase
MITSNPDVKMPEFRLAREIEAFVRSMDLPDDGIRQYLEIHMARIVRTLSITPPPASRSSVLELGAYMHMTPALGCVLGYKEVRGAYFGPLGRTDHKQVRVRGKVVFECEVDLFNAEKDPYPYEDGRYDTVLACEIFEHFLHDPMHMLLECRRVLAPGGSLVITTPNVASYTAVARVLEQSGNPQLYSKYANPLGEFAETEIGHVREYTPQELEEALNCAGFEVQWLFTEIAPGYHAHTWVRDYLKKHGFPHHLRGEQVYCVARKIAGAALTRYPGFLYDM